MRGEEGDNAGGEGGDCAAAHLEDEALEGFESGSHFGALSAELSFDPVKALVDSIEALVNGVEALVDPIEAIVDVAAEVV
jgi:hypothetical protein